MTEPAPLRVCGLLNDQGVIGLDHLRLWRHFNDLLASGAAKRLQAEISIYMTATAHAHMAFVYLRKLLDTPRRAVSLAYLLKAVDNAMPLPLLIRSMAPRAAELRWTESALRQALASHRAALIDLKRRAEPALATVNELIVHVADEHVRDPLGMSARVEQNRVTHDAFRSYFRSAEWIVNGWDLAWRGAQVHWDAPANRDDFAPVHAALSHAARRRPAPSTRQEPTPT